MNALRHIIVVVLSAGMLGGCATTGTNQNLSLKAEADIDYAIVAWQERRDYSTAVNGFEKALLAYQDETFQRDTLAGLALVHLQYGNHEAFLETVQQLEPYFGDREYISDQVQHLFAVAYAMQGKSAQDLPGRGYDPSRVQVTYRLLGVQP